MGLGCSPYIVAQAPILETIEDFWTMVWEYDIPVIAMLTSEIEGGTVSDFWGGCMVELKRWCFRLFVTVTGQRVEVMC